MCLNKNLHSIRDDRVILRANTALRSLANTTNDSDVRAPSNYHHPSAWRRRPVAIQRWWWWGSYRTLQQQQQLR